MLENRRAAFAALLKPTRDGAQAQAATLAELRQRRDKLGTEVGEALIAADGVAFADTKQRDLLARVAGLQAALKTQSGNPEIAALGERVRLSAGVLAWELAQAFPARRWTHRKAMAEIERLLETAGQREAALAQAQREEPQRFERFAARIEALAKQLDGTLPRVTALKSEQQGVAQQIAETALVNQKQRLVAYTVQANFEIAQLIDRATVARNDDRAKR